MFGAKNAAVYIDDYVRMSDIFWPLNLKIRTASDSEIETFTDNLVNYRIFI